MSSLPFHTMTEVQDVLLQTLRIKGHSPDMQQQLQNLQSRVGATLFREASVQLFGILPSQEQQRLAVSLGVQTGSSTLAA